MENKIRVYNDRKYAVGMVLSSGLERVVHAKSYTLLSREDIEYVASNAPALFMDEHQLRLEDREMAAKLGFIESSAQPLMDEAEIRKKLAQRPGLIKEWLDGIVEPFLLDAVYDVAMTMDLPASKLQILRERLPEKEYLDGNAGTEKAE